MDYSQINAAAEGYKADMTRFLRDLVKIPGRKLWRERPCDADQRRNGETWL